MGYGRTAERGYIRNSIFPYRCPIPMRHRGLKNGEEHPGCMVYRGQDLNGVPSGWHEYGQRYRRRKP